MEEKWNRNPRLAYNLKFKFIKLYIDDTHLDASSKRDAEIITQMLIKILFKAPFNVSHMVVDSRDILTVSRPYMKVQIVYAPQTCASSLPQRAEKATRH